MLTELVSKANGHFGSINVSKHGIDRMENEVRPVHHITCRAVPTSRKFALTVINRMLSEKSRELKTNNWAAPFVLAHKNRLIQLLCRLMKVECHSVRDSYPLHRMEKYIDRLGEATVFSTLDAS